MIQSRRSGSGPIRRLCNAAGLLGLSMSCSYVAVAAVVSMQQPAIGGGAVRIPVVLYGDGDEQLSGLQFDLRYDASSYELVEVDTGAAAYEAGKQTVVSAPAPGTGRVLITGFNNETLFDGHVATLVLRPLVPGDNAHALAVENVLASDPLGYDVPVSYEDWYDFPPKPPEKAEPLDPRHENESGSDSTGTEVEAAERRGEQRADAADRAAAPDSEPPSVDGVSAGGVAGELSSNVAGDATKSRENAETTTRRTPSRGLLAGRGAGAGPPSMAGQHQRASSSPSAVRRPTPTPQGSRPGEAGVRSPRPGGEREMAGAEIDGVTTARGAAMPGSTRLALLTPESKSLAPPGTVVGEGLGSPGAAAVPALYDHRVGLVVAVGLVLFVTLAALRAWVLDPVQQRRRGRTQ